MTESITFTWSDVYGEARPSPTTKRRLEEWKKQSQIDLSGVSNEDYAYEQAVTIYRLDFLSDIIGELSNIYDEMLTVKNEE